MTPITINPIGRNYGQNIRYPVDTTNQITSIGGLGNPNSQQGWLSNLNGIGGKLGGALNVDNLQLGLGAVQTLGGLYNSFNQNKLAKRSLGLQEKAFRTNLEGNRSAYNRNLEDTINSRYAVENRSDQAKQYIDDRRLSVNG